MWNVHLYCATFKLLLLLLKLYATYSSTMHPPSRHFILTLMQIQNALHYLCNHFIKTFEKSSVEDNAAQSK